MASIKGKPGSPPVPTYMVYKHPGSHKLTLGMFDYLVVEEGDALNAKLAEGWSMTQQEAMGASESSSSEKVVVDPVKEEGPALEVRAVEKVTVKDRPDDKSEKSEPVRRYTPRVESSKRGRSFGGFGRVSDVGQGK